MNFKANYFNGKSSKTYKANIFINTNSWDITFLDDFKKTEKINWKTYKIKKSEVYTKDLISFNYGDTFPFQKIESSDIDFINYVSKSEHKNINNKIDTFLHKSVKKSIFFLITTIIVISTSMYFFVIPKVAVSFAEKLPKKTIVEFGNYIFKTLSKDLDIDKQKSNNLQHFVDALKIDSDFPITAYVVKSDHLNAFAISGGKFVIYSALLEKLKSEHQLTALIGHEISHIENRHVLKGISRNLSGALFVSILFGDVNAVTSIISENAHLFSQLSFSRSLEKEADIFGLEIMRKNNLDMNGMPELFEILNQSYQIDVPSFLSSHPMLDERITYTRNIASKQNSFKTNSIIKNKWLILKNSDSFNDDPNLIIENHE